VVAFDRESHAAPGDIARWKFAQRAKILTDCGTARNFLQLCTDFAAPQASRHGKAYAVTLIFADWECAYT